MLSRLRGNPRPFVLIGIAVALIITFFAVVGPLFNTSGAVTAEVNGLLPAQATTGRQLEVDLGYDNTGDAVIAHVCIGAAVRGPLRADTVVLQGLDHEAFSGGRACGGSLSGGESISLRIFFTPTGAGTASLSLTPMNGSTAIGAPISGSITIAAH